MYERLDGNLVLRAVDSDSDIDRYAEFNAKYNGESQGMHSRCLFAHPLAERSDFLMIEDANTGEVVSTTCLVPWQCSFDGVPIKAAMLEMVLTHPGYRKKGLIRFQIERFTEKTKDGGYDLGIIWGINYYYRQFGYTYCLDGNMFDTLSVCVIPDKQPDVPELRLRKADAGDADLLQQLHEKTAKQDLYVTRDARHWMFMLQTPRFPAYIAENDDGACGYVIYKKDTGGDIRILEDGFTDAGAGFSILQAFKNEAASRITIDWPEDGTLVKLTRSFGSVPSRRNQWLVRIPDIPVFFRRIAPALDKRLADSIYYGISRDLVINLYDRAYKLRFTDGKLTDAADIGFKDASMYADGGDICIPRDAFTRLLLGYRTLDQLFDAWPDICVKPETRGFIDALFPLMSSYFNTPYAYQGQ